ncbi:MAG: glycosyltransferase [Bacillaceae bacterium]|nr:glycosyltransferase [Bacillaceae bacterium]
MKNVLIASFDMEVGGVERSLLSMLTNFNYEQYKVDLMLYRHTGDFMNQLPDGPTLLKECPSYKTFRMSIGETLKSGQYVLSLIRLLAKCKASLQKSTENGYKQMQYMWKYALPFLPKQEKEYDVAISYLWPHYFVAYQVKAKTKIAWIHTDFSTVDTDIKLDLEMWEQFTHIVAVSESCKDSFLKKYPSLLSKVVVIENIMSPSLVRELANEVIENPMLQDNRFKIVTVARLSYAKGIDQAIKALKLLRNKGYDNIAWYVVGYGGDEKMLRNLIEENQLENHFILLGKQLNPYPFMKEADLYVQPSRYEGKAVTVGEAQILGKAVLISNYKTAKSQVVCGINGVISGTTPEDLTNSIISLYKDETLITSLVTNCMQGDFNNESELNKLYSLTN